MKSEKESSIVEFEQWKRDYPEKSIPKGLSKKQKSEWLSEAYIAKDGRKLMISGGGRLLLWFANLHGGWTKLQKDNKKRGNVANYNEVLKFKYREKMFGLNLLKNMPKKEIEEVLEDD